MDDSFLAVPVPFPIRLYGTTTSTPSIQSNGVSVCFDEFAYSTQLKCNSLLEICFLNNLLFEVLVVPV